MILYLYDTVELGNNTFYLAPKVMSIFDLYATVLSKRYVLSKLNFKGVALRRSRLAEAQVSRSNHVVRF